MTVYTVPLPWRSPPLNLNDRDARAVHNRKVAEARSAAGWAVKTAGVPKLDRVLVALHWRPAATRTRDTDNPVATLKPCCDGIVDAGVVKDDSPQYMVKLMPIIHEPAKPAAVWLTIETISDSPAGGGVHPSAGDTTSPPRGPTEKLQRSVGSQPRGGEPVFRVDHPCRPDSPVVHELKTWPGSFQAVAAGVKRVELRANDRGFRVGDLLRLEEYDPDTATYTGMGCVRRVTHVLPGGMFGLAAGHVALSLEVVDGSGQSTPDWKRIAVKLASAGADFIRLSTAEADALRGALEDANAIEAETRCERAADAATYHQEEL